MILATGDYVAERRIHNAVTFIELLLVIVIIGILIGISVPRFRKTFNHLQLNSSSRELQASMNYLRQRSIVEGKPIYLNIDSDTGEYWAEVKDVKNRLRTYRVPIEIRIEAEQKQIIFYPDGSIDKVTISLIGSDNQNVTLTTKGVFSGIKLQSQE